MPRFIPSCEGQTWIQYTQQARISIHPFLRRADGLNLQKARICIEPTIPAKGRQRGSGLVVMPRGFIPSCEGQTLLRIKTPTSWSNHPLPRGANLFSCPSIWMPRDSSPHARGRLLFGHVALVEHRFIPSCEGQTLSVYADFSRLKHLVVQFA